MVQVGRTNDCSEWLANGKYMNSFKKTNKARGITATKLISF